MFKVSIGYICGEYFNYEEIAAASELVHGMPMLFDRSNKISDLRID